MAETTETERAIETVSVVCSKLDRGITYKDEWNVNDPKIAIYLAREDLAALRHLISEARKVDRVKAKHATLRPQPFVTEPTLGEAWSEGFYEAWEDVMRIVSPDSETKP